MKPFEKGDLVVCKKKYGNSVGQIVEIFKDKDDDYPIQVVFDDGGLDYFCADGKYWIEDSEPSLELYVSDIVKSASALDKQVDGNHYASMKIQPIEFITANQLDFLQGNIIKYICRHKSKNGRKDIEKAIHYCELILEMQYKD